MPKNWKKDIGEAVNENRKNRKIRNGISIVGVTLASISFAGFILTNSIIDKIFLPVFAVLYIGSFVIMLSSKFLVKTNIMLSNGELFSYYLYDLSNRIEKYQDIDTPLPNKKELKKQIYRILDKIETIAYRYERYSKRSVYPNFDEKTFNFLKKTLYKINYALKNNNTFDSNLLNQFKKYAEDNMNLLEDYEKRSLSLKKQNIDLIKKHIQKEDDELFGKFRMKILENMPVSIKFVLFAIISFVVIWLSFHFVIANFYSLTDSDIVNNSVLTWTGILILCAAIYTVTKRKE